jgi:5-methylcytosine-specific restriction endonuclease McrA
MSKVAPTLKEKIRREAGNRCGYCLSRQELVLSVLEIDHLVPTGAGGSDDEDNLWLACRACNNA